ncbi:PAS modulated Fis family sigma-54-specific transcriptional regulator [Thermincola ferriacetica]|uniref:PAS modulated Fis family sigma-54-specific transcriptional regulator n=1 Tax=Thermincola ferriacetica TaxID=281456 RepID=A0A0L6W5E6_9FIRM|nr:sigma-54-dependent Fis family transcriptional regulator [Thermincola ferriacetica]KNZ70750.1 PAS modulated Fis family sigma-54-specific transcriptional regulator [Thermincola ferriacetica]
MGQDISRAEMEVIMNVTHDAMIGIGLDGKINIFNRAAEKITGFKAEEVIGKNIKEVIPTTKLFEVMRTGCAELNQSQLLGNTKIITNRVPVRDENGIIIGAVAVFRDVTEITALSEQITDVMEMRSLLEAIINSTQDAISVCDENGLNILVNPAYTRITGLKPEEVLHKPATIDIAEGESVHMQVLKTRKAVRGVPMKVGRFRREVVVNVAPILIGDKLKGSVGIIHDISEIKRLSDELDKVKSLIRRMTAKYTFDDIIGSCELMASAIDQAKRAAETPATVLLRGESGTGKELFAHAIHNASVRRRGPFVRVNCAAIAEPILESELFGYVEGAFTGAVKSGKKGYFEEADGGTIFLDEIGEVNPSVQAKLLRVLQEKEIVRVGGTKPVPVDVRVIAATNANLEQRVSEGTFREDLYYRLNVVPIFVPPLRARKEDIPLLIDHLCRKYSLEYGRKVAEITPEALDVLMHYDWPGNVRELENIISRTIINMKYNETTILPHHVPALGRAAGPQWQAQKAEQSIPVPALDGSLEEVLAAVEKKVLQQALATAGGNKTKAARMLGISNRSLYYKLERHGISMK